MRLAFIIIWKVKRVRDYYRSRMTEFDDDLFLYGIVNFNIGNVCQIR